MRLGMRRAARGACSSAAALAGGGAEASTSSPSVSGGGWVADRILPGGALEVGGGSLRGRTGEEEGPGGGPRAGAAPECGPAPEEAVQRLAEFVALRRRLVVVTGAGVSTESDLPCYRGEEGAYSRGFKPMTHQQFLSGPDMRRRYWARSFFGFPKFNGCRPNAAHHALAALQATGAVAPTLLTQNVDRLHHRAGSRSVVEIHGSTHDTVCLSCGATGSRAELQERLAILNPDAAAVLAREERSELSAERENRLLGAGGESRLPRAALGVLAAAAPPDAATREGPRPPNVASAVLANVAEDGRLVAEPGAGLPQAAAGRGGQTRPDGDTELDQELVESFRVPTCQVCGGVLKPHVVFFGDNLPRGRKEALEEEVRAGDGLLVVGSSLSVFSAFRLARQAKEEGKPIAMVTAGQTRADDLLDLKLACLAGDVLPRLAGALGLPAAAAP